MSLECMNRDRDDRWRREAWQSSQRLVSVSLPPLNKMPEISDLWREHVCWLMVSETPALGDFALLLWPLVTQSAWQRSLFTHGSQKAEVGTRTDWSPRSPLRNRLQQPIFLLLYPHVKGFPAAPQLKIYLAQHKGLWEYSRPKLEYN